MEITRTGEAEDGYNTRERGQIEQRERKKGERNRIPEQISGQREAPNPVHPH